MSGTPANLGAEEESVGMSSEDIQSAKIVEEQHHPKAIFAPVSRKRKPVPTREKITVSVTFFTAITLPFAVTLGCLLPWHWQSTLLGRIGIIGTFTIDAMILWSLLATVLSDPYADPRWVPTDRTEEELQQIRQKAPKAEEESIDEKLARAVDYYDCLSYCTKCEAWKPPRCHHCRYCGRCTLVYDHHCGWVSSCIGYPNHKSFLLFVIYSTILVSFSLVAFFKAVMEQLGVIVFHLTFRFVLCAFYLVLLGYLLLALLKMLRDQLITLRDGENIVESVVHLRVRHFQPNFISPFQKGIYGNWKALMGETPLEWLLPFTKKATFSSYAYVLEPSTSHPVPFYAGVH